jgi:hypothetical protein
MTPQVNCKQQAEANSKQQQTTNETATVFDTKTYHIIYSEYYCYNHVEELLDNRKDQQEQQEQKNEQQE